MDILGIGFAELMFILVIAMMVFGPRRLPEMAAKAGKIVADLRNMSQGLLTEWQREINAATQLDDELRQTRQELAGVKNELTQAKKAIVSNTTEVANAIAPSTLAAQINPQPATTSNPEPTISPPPPVEIEDAVQSVVDPAPANGTADTGDSQPETSIESTPPTPPKTVPTPVSRPLVTAKNGAVDELPAPAQNPGTESETTVDEQ